MAITMGTQLLEVRGDSDLAISQINMNFKAKDPWMIAYRDEVQCLECHFDSLEFHHVKHADNVAADTLTKMGAL